MIWKFLYRNLFRHSFLNFIRILGLSLALSSSLLIMLYIKYELSYDRYHSNADRIYRFTLSNPSFLGGKHFARIYNSLIVPEMAAYFPEIETFVRMTQVVGGGMKLENRFVSVHEGFLVDSTFLDVFDVQLLSGNPAGLLSAPGSMIISEHYAKTLFGDASPLGRVLTIPSGQFYGEDMDFVINGVMKDFPANSHFHPDFISSPRHWSDLNGWSFSYLLLKETADPTRISGEYSDFYLQHLNPEATECTDKAHLQALKDIHLHSHKTREIEANSSVVILYSFAMAMLLLIVIALFNFINLSIGMAGFGDRYLYVNRIFGAGRGMHYRYLLTEGSVLLLAASLLSLFFLVPGFNFIESRFNLDLLKGNLPVILIATAFFALLVLFTGNILMIRQLVDFSNSTRGGGAAKRQISKGLILVQNTFSIALIVAVIVIHRQAAYAIQSGIGSGDRGLVCLADVHMDIQAKFVLFKDELKNYPSIRSVTAMMEQPGGEANDMFSFTLEDYIPDESNKMDHYIGIFPCDYSFASTFDLTFLAGQDFSEKYEDNEGSGEYIINRSALNRLGYSDPAAIIGKRFALFFEWGDIPIPPGSIRGVVEDFHLSSLKRAVDPLVFFKRKDIWLLNFIVAFQSGMETQGMKDLEASWEKLFPEYPFEPEFVDMIYTDLYSGEVLQANLLTLFTVIALFISSIGLLGLSLLMTQKRIKEIGVRRVNGAVPLDILILLNRDFLKWILISVALSIPLAWLAMQRWLAVYSYRTPLRWWIFVLAGVLAIFLALLTVSLQAWKTARSNPVEALRHE